MRIGFTGGLSPDRAAAVSRVAMGLLARQAAALPGAAGPRRVQVDVHLRNGAGDGEASRRIAGEISRRLDGRGGGDR